MNRNISEEKYANLKSLVNDSGVIAAMAMDQRGSLKKAIAEAIGIEKEQVSYEMMSEFKSAVVEILSPYASAVLLDPEYGLEAAELRAKGCGLLLAYEKSGYDNTSPGRMPELIEGFSVKKLKELGANAVKLLIYYNPFEEEVINNKKHALVRRVGEECRLFSTPFLLEFVGYGLKDEDEKGLEYARKKPEIARRSIEEFSKDIHRVDVLKVEIPVNMKFVEGTASFAGVKAYTKDEALGHFTRAAEAAAKPFIYLSAGVPHSEFIESLDLAIESGVKFNGVLSGRATWSDGITVYAKQGLEALKQWLRAEGVSHIGAINERLKRANPLD